MKNEKPKVLGHEFRLKWSEIIMSLGCVGIGLVLVLCPQVAETIITTVIGAVAIVIGIGRAISYLMADAGNKIENKDLTIGLLWIAGGIVFIIMGPALFALMPVMLGFFILFCGINKVQYTLNLRRMNSSAWKAELIAACIFSLMGILIIANPFGTIYTLLRIVGIVLVIEGIYDFVAQYLYQGAYNRYVVTGSAAKENK